MHPEPFRGQLVRRIIAESVDFLESTGSRLLRSAMALDPGDLFQLVDVFLNVPPLVKMVRVLLEFSAQGQCAEAVHDVLAVRDEVDPAGALDYGRRGGHDLSSPCCLVFARHRPRSIRALSSWPVDAITAPRASRPLRVTTSFCVGLDRRALRVEVPWPRKQILHAPNHLHARGPVHEVFWGHSAVENKDKGKKEETTGRRREKDQR